MEVKMEETFPIQEKKKYKEIEVKKEKIQDLREYVPEIQEVNNKNSKRRKVKPQRKGNN